MNNYRSQTLQAVFIGTVFLQLASDTSAYFSRANLLYLYGHPVKLEWKCIECYF
jgi:hypothetical protein